LSARLRNGIIIAVVGITLIILGIFVFSRLFDTTSTTQEQVPTPEPEAKVQVVVAVHDILLGTVIQEGDVELVEIPVRYVTRDTIADLDEVLGSFTKVDLVQGEMVLEHNLANPTEISHDISYVLDENHVLMAIPATDLMSRESIIQRGDVVDLLVSIEQELETINLDGERILETYTVTFNALQRINITALVVDIIQEEENTRVATDTEGEEIIHRNDIVVKAYLVALDPQDALIVKHLKDIGAVFDFVLRSPTSSVQYGVTPVTSEFLRELYGLEIIP
jgi:pilus assembly protein CpaB